MQIDHRRHSFIRLCLSTLAGVGIALCLFGAARTQANGSVLLSGLNTKNFPVVQASLTAYDANNEFIRDLKAANILLHEGTQEITPFSFQYSRPGVQFVTAISLGPAMSVRDGEGKSRFDYLKSELLIQAGYFAADEQDDFSLVVAGGPELVHNPSIQEWADTAANFEPDNLRNSQADLEILGRALEIANDPTPRPGMGRAILYITPPHPLSSSPGLLNLAATAKQHGVRIFVWLVASPADALTVNSDALKELAVQTGGKFQNFDQPKVYPAINADLEPFRSLYTLGYTSTLRANGIYTVSAEVRVSDVSLVSNPIDIQVNLQVPNPIFAGLPVRIERWGNPITTTSSLSQPSMFEFDPDQQVVDIFIEFPDGHTRDVAKSILYVNDQAVDVNENAPFDRFDWDISGIVDNSTSVLRVEVVDSLGLTGSSMEMPVEIHIDLPKTATASQQISLRIILMIFLGLLALSALVGLGLLLAGRLQPRLLGQGRKWQKTPRRSSPATIPLTQPQTKPVPKPAGQTRRLPTWISRLQYAPVDTTTQPLAYLTPFDAEGEPCAPIPIQSNETTFGSDGGKASWTIDDPSLQGLHARLRREGSFYRLLDEGSVAGTWINYCEVPPGGARLYHGDLVHFGKIGFRFTLRDTRHPRKAQVTLYTGHTRNSSNETH